MSDDPAYRPARPPGLPDGVALPRPRRPQVRSALLWVALVIAVIGSGLITVVTITSETGAVGLVAGALLSAIPVIPVIAAFLWLDRYEAEPPVLLAASFAWGAAVATFGALVINTASLAAVKAAGGDVSTTAVFIAPVVEETFKGLAVVVVLILRRREFDGVIDGIVYAGMSGIGFAFLENILYLGRTLAEHGSGGLVFVFLLRCVVSPFAHPLFTSAIGIGIGIAVRSRNPLVKVVAPLLGWCVAILLHGTWNLTATSGLAGFVVAYVVFQIPVFAAVAALALWARRREGRLIGRHLVVYARSGWLTPDDVTMLASLARRRDARSWAERTGGSDAERAMRDFQELGSELAFLRERMERGTAPPDAQQQEYAMLAAMSELRARFVPRWHRTQG